MGLRTKALHKGNLAARKTGYWVISLGLLILSLVLSVQVVPRAGQASRLSLGAAPVHAEEAPGLRFRFVDTETDARLNPDVLLIDGEDFASRVVNGQLDLPAESKSYMVTVIKEGFEMMDEVFIEASSGAKAEFRLLPSEWLDRPDKYDTANLDEKQGRLIGYVRDSATGAPLPGATVSLVSQKQQATADANGYFSLDYAVTAQDPTDPMQIDLDTLRIAAEGYIPQERLYVQLLGGNIIQYLTNLDKLDPALRGASPTFVQTIDERTQRGGMAALGDSKTPNAPFVRMSTPDDLGPSDPTLQAEPMIDSGNKVAGIRSHTIRIGRSCSCRNCSTVLVLNLEDYARRVLPREWLASWSLNSLEAGAVAVRSYGGSFILSPISSRYDICDNTCCQVFGDSTSSRTNTAVQTTQGLFVVTGPIRGGRPFRAEYSAENNLAPPCRRDGSTGTCLSDVVCTGFRTNGHGRGMCQWGSQRWGSGAPRSGGAKDRVWILEHYYTNNPGYSGRGVKLGHW